MRNKTTIINMRKWTLDKVTDEDLITRYARGSSEAFECLYERHKKGLFSFLRRQTNSAAIAEDLAHDTWLAVINRADGYIVNAKFKTWLYRIAHNRLIDRWRKQGSAVHSLFEEVEQTLQAHDSNAAIEQIELAQLLENLAALSAEQTTALLLKIEGFSHAEIAQITNSKQETVKSRLRYATQHLRVAMEVSS